MIPIRGCERFARCDASTGGHFDLAGGRFRARRTHSSLRLHQLSARHPEVGQREQRVQLRGVLGKAAVAL